MILPRMDGTVKPIEVEVAFSPLPLQAYPAPPPPSEPPDAAPVDPPLASPQQTLTNGDADQREQPAYVVPIAPAKEMTAAQVIECFIVLDVDRNGQLTNEEFIQGLKVNWQIAQKFGLEQNIVLEDVPREKYDLVFGQIDYDSSKTISVSMDLECLCNRIHICSLFRRFGSFSSTMGTETLSRRSLPAFCPRAATRASI
jgi:hypothetical protein